MKLVADAIGTIDPFGGLPTTKGNPTHYVASIISTFIDILLIVGFVLGIVWILFAGYRFITAGGDEKAVSSAWSSIYWGLLGLAIVVGSFAIIKMVEIFFNINIVTNFTLPQQK